jgi:DNA-binding IclR family transcriptional regulator
MTPPPEHGAQIRARQPKAIHSALEMLEEVARCGPGVTAREVSENLGVPRATTYRLLNLLVQEEYLVRLPDLSGFALGRKVSQLAGMAAPSRPPQAVREVLDTLRGTTRGGIHLARYSDTHLRAVDADPDFPLSDPARIIRYLDASSMGRLLLLELSDTGRLGNVPLEREPSAVLAIISDTRARGYAVQLGELAAGYGCLTVPIRDSAGLLVAGLSFAAPQGRVEHPAAVLEALRSTSLQLAPFLG